MNKKFKALALAALLTISAPAISKASEIKDERKIDLSISDIKYPVRNYDQRVTTLVSEFSRLKQLEAASYNMDADPRYNIENISLDTVYNAISVLNFRFPFDGLNKDELDRASLETFMFLHDWGFLAGKYGTEGIKFSTYLEDSRDYQSVLDVENLVEIFNNIVPTEEQIRNGNVEDWNNIIFATREFDRNAYIPPVELMSLLVLNGALYAIPSNYIITDPLNDVLIPMEGRARNDIMEDETENKVDFYSTNEAGTLFTQWSEYPAKSSIEDYYGGEYTEQELLNLQAPPKVREMGEFYRYGVRSDAEEILNKAMDSLLSRMRAQAISKDIINVEAIEIDAPKVKKLV